MTTITISSGTTIVSTTISDTASYIVEDGGTLDVGSGGTVSGLIIISSGGAVDITSGGTILDTTDAGGTVNVSAGGTANNTTLSSGGIELVQSGGIAGDTILSGGAIEVLSGGTADGTIAFAGTVNVSAGGTADNTTLTSGGIEFVQSGGIAGDTILSGGALDVLSGGTADGTITFAGGGTLVLDQSTSFHGLISGFTYNVPDSLDVGDIGFGANTTVSFTEAAGATSGTLAVSDGTETANITLAGQYTTGNFTLASDGSGGTLVTDPSLFPHLEIPGVALNNPNGTLNPLGSVAALCTGGTEPSGLHCIIAPIFANILAQYVDPANQNQEDNAILLFQECYGGGLLAAAATKLNSIQRDGVPWLPWVGGAAAPWYLPAQSFSGIGNRLGATTSPWTTILIPQLTSAPNVYQAINTANSLDFFDPDPQASNTSAFPPKQDDGAQNIGIGGLGSTGTFAFLWDSVAIPLPEQIEPFAVGLTPYYDVTTMAAAITQAFNAAHSNNPGNGTLHIVELIGNDATQANLERQINASGFNANGQYIFYASGHGALANPFLCALQSIPLVGPALSNQASSLVGPLQNANVPVNEANPGLVKGTRSDPQLTLDYSGVVTSNTVEVFWNDVSLGYLQPGQTEQVFNIADNAVVEFEHDDD